MSRPPPWLEGPVTGFYAPAKGGRMVVAVDPITTAMVAAHHRGKNSPHPLYMFITAEGTARMSGPKSVEDWDEAVQIALDEGIFIYNARSKKCSRPVWSAKPEDRTRRNMFFEEVKLMLDRKVYFETLPSVRAKILHIEE